MRKKAFENESKTGIDVNQCFNLKLLTNKVKL